MKLIPHWCRRRLRLFETEGGRNIGWYVERDGVRLAELSHSRWEDQNFYSYILKPLTGDSALNQQLLSNEFWYSPGGDCPPGVIFVNREFPELFTRPIYIPGLPFIEPGRLMIKGVDFDPLPRMPWDYLLHWWRSHRP